MVATITTTRQNAHGDDETPGQGMRRLAFAALNHGLRVLEYAPTREFYATSYSEPDRLHRVTRVSCDCRGFVRHGRCSHHALLLFHLRELPEPTPPSPCAAAPIPTPMVICDDCGERMTHHAGVSFRCQCGATFAPGWQEADVIDRRLCELSRTEPDAIEWAESLLARGHRPGDEEPDREDVPDALGLIAYSANEVAAVLIWRSDLQESADRLAA